MGHNPLQGSMTLCPAMQHWQTGLLHCAHVKVTFVMYHYVQLNSAMLFVYHNILPALGPQEKLVSDCTCIPPRHNTVILLAPAQQEGFAYFCGIAVQKEIT